MPLPPYTSTTSPTWLLEALEFELRPHFTRGDTEEQTRKEHFPTYLLGDLGSPEDFAGAMTNTEVHQGHLGKLQSWQSALLLETLGGTLGPWGGEGGMRARSHGERRRDGGGWL